jgi:hypothetical protein
MKHKPESLIPVPPRVQSLIGMRFGRLVVKHYAGQNKWGHTYWCCLCDCGNLCRVRSGCLRGRDGTDRPPQKSCGCLHTDPGVRAAAILKVPAKRRAEVCENARAVVRLRPGPYSMDTNRAALLLGCSVKYIEILAKDNMIGSMNKRGALWVSSKDVRRLVATQRRNKRHRQAIEQWESFTRLVRSKEGMAPAWIMARSSSK